MLAIRLRCWEVLIRREKKSQDGNLSALLGLIGGMTICVCVFSLVLLLVLRYQSHTMTFTLSLTGHLSFVYDFVYKNECV